MLIMSDISSSRCNMTTLEKLAEDLHMKPDQLMGESLGTFLRHKLKVVEAELFLLAKRYEVRDVQEFDRALYRRTAVTLG